MDLQLRFSSTDGPLRASGRMVVPQRACPGIWSTVDDAVGALNAAVKLGALGPDAGDACLTWTTAEAPRNAQQSVRPFVLDLPSRLALAVSVRLLAARGVAALEINDESNTGAMAPEVDLELLRTRPEVDFECRCSIPPLEREEWLVTLSFAQPVNVAETSVRSVLSVWVDLLWGGLVEGPIEGAGRSLRPAAEVYPSSPRRFELRVAAEWPGVFAWYTLMALVSSLHRRPIPLESLTLA